MKNIEKTIKNNIEKQVKRYDKKRNIRGKRLILFGCVPGAKILRDVLAGYNLNIECVVDNNSVKWGQKCMGIDISSPEEILLPYDSNILIFVWSNYWKEMCKQLQTLGYTRQLQVLVLFDFKEAGVFNDGIISFMKDLYKALHGFSVYKKYLKERDMLFLCPYKGTGDVYMAGRYFEEYINLKGIKSYSFLVMNVLGERVASLFAINNIVVITEREKEYILHAYDYFGPDEMRLKPLLYWGWHTKKMIIPRFCKTVNFNDMFKHDVYDLSKETKGKKPIYKTSKQKISEFFYNNKLIMNKTVILSPYAGSFVSDIPTLFWEKLASRFKEKGFSVCTNSANEREPVIKGTKGIIFDLDDTVPILENAGIFIGFRSGLCDLASSARCKKIIVYETGFNASQYEFFSLVRMELCNDAIEIIYTDETADCFLEKVWKQIWKEN